VLIADGVRPSSNGRGYVLRRLVRRALTELWRADPDSPLTLADLVPPDLVRHTAALFGQPTAAEQVRAVLQAEEGRFRELLARGRSLLRRLFPAGRLSEADYGFLHDTHGLPRELVTDVLARMTAGD
jgi:alanyl-tRNA synthetase